MPRAVPLGGNAKGRVPSSKVGDSTPPDFNKRASPLNASNSDDLMRRGETETAFDNAGTRNTGQKLKHHHQPRLASGEMTPIPAQRKVHPSTPNDSIVKHPLTAQTTGEDIPSLRQLRDVALIEPGAQLHQRFAPILFAHTVSHILHGDGRNKWSHHSGWWARTRRVIGGAFLIGRFHASNLHIWIAAYHFVPLFTVVLALTVNLLLHVVMGIIFPIIGEAFASAAQLKETWPHGMPADSAFEALGLYVASLRPYVEAFVTAGLVFAGGATVGYKLLTVIADAAIDMSRLVRHPTAQVEMGYYLLFTQLKLLWRFGALGMSLLVGFVVATCGLAAAICFTPHFGIEWSARERNVFYVAVALIGVQSMWVTLQALSFLFLQTDAVTEESVAMWWSTKLPTAQRWGVMAMVVAALVFCLEFGAVYAVTCLAEGLVYLNFAHLIVSVSARMALFTLRTIQSIHSVLTDSVARRAAILFAMPLLAILVFNFCVVRSPIVFCLQLPPLALFVDALCQHTHEYRNAGASRRTSVRGVAAPLFKPPPSTLRHDTANADLAWSAISRIGVKALFLAQSNSFVNEVHFRPRSVFRAVVRLTMGLFVAIVIALAAWVSLQFHPQFQRESTARCEWTGPSSIRVRSDVLVADLYQLNATDVDASALVYEADPSRRDRRRYESICQRRWGGDLHAADLAYFSTMAYLLMDGTDFGVMFDFYRQMRRNASDWQVVNTRARFGSDGGRDESIAATFHHFSSESLNTSVIAIRGTDPTFARDFLQNVLIFSEVFLFQAIAFLVPGASLLPESLVRDLIRVASTMDVAIFDFAQRRDRHHYFRDVEDYVARITAERKQHVVLTGHSLGGVVAQIVGARLRLPAVAFSSPGIALMDRKFGIDADAIDAYITNVILSNDFIVHVGKLGGSVTHVQCEYRRPMICHSIELQTIRLWSTCSAYRDVSAINGTYAILPMWHHQYVDAFGRYVESFGRSLSSFVFDA